MEYKINLNKKNFIVLAVVFSVVLFGVYVTADYTNPIPNPGHGADEIIYEVDGSEFNLQDDLSYFLNGASITGISYDADECHDMNLDFVDAGSILTSCNSNEVIVAVQTYRYDNAVGQNGEFFVTGIRCCDLVLS